MMEIELKRKDILALWNVIKKFADEKVSKKFIYAISINESVLKLHTKTTRNIVYLLP